MIETILAFVAKSAISAAGDALKNVVLGIEYQGVSIEEMGKHAVLMIFFMKSVRPELSFEKRAEIRMDELQREIDGVKEDIKELKLDMSAFKWKVDTLFYESREENLWQEMLNLDSASDSFYAQLSTLTKSRQSDEDKRWRASELATNIVSGLQPHIANTRTRLLGDDVGAGSERVRGFLEIWREQALRDADKGWDNARLVEIYDLLQAKFTRVLLIQFKCVRLLIEAYETLHAEGASEQDGLDYYSATFFPVLKREVEGFRDMIESLAVNITPLPTGSMLPYKIPSEVEGIFAGLDMFMARALGGKLAGGGAQGGRQLPDAPAVAGCFGRVVVPSTRWIRRAPGSKEEARVSIAAGGRKVTCKGTLEVRAVKYTPYKDEKGEERHKGYQIQVGNEPRDMDRVLVAHFTPSEVLPPDIVAGDGSQPLDVALETGGGEVLAQAKAYVLPVKVGEATPTTVPYGTFTMSFTGGAGVRSR